MPIRAHRFSIRCPATTCLKGRHVVVSMETAEWLNRNVLIGYTRERGNAWHYRSAAQGDEPNHYPGPIPVDDIQRRLFHWRAIPGRVLTHTDLHGLRPCPDRMAVVADD